MLRHVTDGTLLQDIQPEPEAQITVEEPQLAVKHRVLRQLPVEDGISWEFYIIFWDFFKNDLLPIYIYIYSGKGRDDYNCAKKWER
jgi:hypothetical protein